MKKISLLFFSLFFLGTIANAQYTVETVPNPKDNGGGYVSDPDKVLKQETVAAINSIFTELEKKTSDQVALVVVKSIGEKVPKDFVYELFNKWGIGIKGKDNGLLLLMVMDQRRVEFETGYGMESVLPDALCKRIQVTYMVPEFKKGNYDEGLLNGITATVDILENAENSEYFIKMKNARNNSLDEEIKTNVTVILAFLFFVVVLISFFVKRSRKTFSTKQNID